MLLSTTESVWSVEGRLLYDLQNICLDSEREIFALQPWRALFSGGRISPKRPLPNQKIVRLTKHLSVAKSRLPNVRLDKADRDSLLKFLREASEKAEETLRQTLRSLIIKDLIASGLNRTICPSRFRSIGWPMNCWIWSSNAVI